VIDWNFSLCALTSTLRPPCRHGVPGIDGIVLTHDHADAMLGLDDVRSIQVGKRGLLPG